MKLVCCCFVRASFSVAGDMPASGEELLVNGDFEVGTPKDDKRDPFNRVNRIHSRGLIGFLRFPH